MLNKIISLFRGTLAMLLLITNIFFFAIVILIAALIAKMLPGRLHQFAMPYALKLPNYWMFCNRGILKLSTYGKWEVSGSNHLNKKGWHIIIANHESWMDILVLGSVFCQKIPVLKFFMKKELLWQLPIAGLDCYLLGYPILARHSRAEIRKKPELKGKDIESTQKACQQFKKFPSTFMNFVEGTRFSKAKHEKQNSPYNNLLKPKSAGTAIVLTEMADKLDGIINVTIHYDAENKSLWKFLCGDVKKIYVHYELIKMEGYLIGNYYKDREYRKHFQQWLNTLWEEKDALISSFKERSL